MPMDDATLLERWTQCRDTDAFNEIAERFAGQVYATCLRVLCNTADAEEVAQECFFALARSSGDVRSSLGGWLHRVATFKSRDRIRGEARRRNREQVFGASLPTSVEPQWNDIRQHVDEAIEMLPEELRSALVAHFLGRKTQVEIAEELGITRRAVSYRIAHGLEAVRGELRRHGVELSAYALGTGLTADLSAAPLSLKASLGKLAIACGSSPGVSGAATTTSVLGSLILMKTKSLAVAGIFILLAAGSYFAWTRTSPGAQKGTPDLAASSGTLEAPPAPPQSPAPAPPAKATLAVLPETPSLTGLLALSRGELELALKYYPPIADSAQYAAVSGVVLGGDGYPVPGALVALVPTHNWGKMPLAEEIARTAASGRDGLYRIAGIEREGDYRVVASKQGFKSEAQYAAVNAGEEATVDFTLQAGLSLQGHVVSASGESVPNAYVYCIGATGPRLNKSDLSRASQTGPDGRFTLGFAEEERGLVAALRVQSAKNGAATFPDVLIQSERTVELRLAAPAVIRGMVKDRSHKPLAGAHVTFYAQKTIGLTRDDGEKWSSPSYAGSFVAVSGASGRYATEVDAGMEFQAKVEMHGSGDGNERLDKIPTLAPGETREYDPVFDTESMSIRATLVGQQSGRPFASYVSVEAIAFKDGEEIARSQQEGQSALRFTLPAERASYTFQARYVDNEEVAGNISKPYRLSGGEEIEIELDLPDPQSFAVRTLDPNGRPVEGAAIKLLAETSGSGPAIYGRTSADGRLAEPILFPPSSGAQLLVEASGYAMAHGPVYADQHPGAVHPEETIVLWPGAGFEGVLLDGGKQPLKEMALIVSVTNRDGQQWHLQTTTDAGGHFAIVNQAPADVVNIVVGTRDGSRFWTGDQVQLEADAITGLGEMVLK